MITYADKNLGKLSARHQLFGSGDLPQNLSHLSLGRLHGGKPRTPVRLRVQQEIRSSWAAFVLDFKTLIKVLIQLIKVSPRERTYLDRLNSRTLEHLRLKHCGQLRLCTSSLRTPGPPGCRSSTETCARCPWPSWNCSEPPGWS